MDQKLYLAAIEGDEKFLRDARDREIESGCWHDFFQSLTTHKNNIIHIASQHDQYDFLKCGFNFQIFSPLMISQRNANGDTPIHVASKRGNINIVEHLVEISKVFGYREVSISNEVVAEEENGEDCDENNKWAWRVKNTEGNTPLHDAIIDGKLEVAKFLVEFDPDLASLVNNNGETSLHLAIKYNVDGDDEEFYIGIIEHLQKQQPGTSYERLLSCSLKPKKSEEIIKLLLQKQKTVVYVKDKDGLTPILRAARESQLRAIDIILKECPEASEMCDPKGRTILHLVRFRTYEDAKKCMKHRQILALKDQQDHMGNTPAHVVVMECIKAFIMEDQRALLRDDHLIGAKGQKTSLLKSLVNILLEKKEERVVIKDHHIGMIRALVESSANFTLKNKEGQSAAALLQPLISHAKDTGALLKLDMEIKEMVAKHKNMILTASLKFESKHNQTWKALEDPELYILRQEFDALKSWLSDGSFRVGDLLHILLQACKPKNNKTNKINYNEVEEFMIELLESNPVLLSQTNSRGDALLHIMAKDHDHKISEHFAGQIDRLCEKHFEQDSYLPWKVKNMVGNTPLHEALSHAPNCRKVKMLLENDKRNVFADVNNEIETPLHVLCRYNKEEQIEEQLIMDIINANVSVTYYRDAHGLTPLLRAAKEGRIDIVRIICKISSDSAQLRDLDGRTIFHLMDMSKATDRVKSDLTSTILNNDELKVLVTAEDIHGDTPLHLALKRNNSQLAEFLTTIRTSATRSVYEELKKEDVDMQYVLFLLSFAKRIPRKFEHALLKTMAEVGKKSFFGVPEDKIEEYISMIGVVAVLIATIAFQAAFTPPGKGAEYLDPKKQPIIIRAAYWVFMVSDLLTISFSITLLFCLIWILTGDQKDRLVMTDVSLLLLQGSFLTVMISLMAGVFALTFDTSPNLAWFTLIVCCSTLLFLQKPIVMNFLQFAFLTLFLVWKIIWTPIINRVKKADKEA